MRSVEIEDIRKQDYLYDEAIKTLRTNIQMTGKRIKTILITSCYPNEGKSDISISLAKELSSIGKKVLLIDADIRKSAYFSHFLVNQEVRGLSEFLSGQITVGNIIDAVLVARYCDGAVFVIEQGAVSYRFAQKSVNRIRKTGCRVLGSVLNKTDRRQDKYYKKYGQYYQKTEVKKEA